MNNFSKEKEIVEKGKVTMNENTKGELTMEEEKKEMENSTTPTAAEVSEDIKKSLDEKVKETVTNKMGELKNICSSAANVKVKKKSWIKTVAVVVVVMMLFMYVYGTMMKTSYNTGFNDGYTTAIAKMENRSFFEKLKDLF